MGEEKRYRENLVTGRQRACIPYIVYRGELDMRKNLRQKLKKEVILLDGAFGTYAQALGLNDSHFKGKLGCLEYLSLASPELVTRIHHDYLEAGSDAVETNTFGANAIKLSEYGLMVIFLSGMI